MTDHSDSPELARADAINAELCKIASRDDLAVARILMGTDADLAKPAPKRRKPNRYAFAAVSFLAKMIGCKVEEDRPLEFWQTVDARGRGMCHVGYRD